MTLLTLRSVYFSSSRVRNLEVKPWEASLVTGWKGLAFPRTE